MPPKALARPAAAVGRLGVRRRGAAKARAAPKGAPKAKAKAGAKAKARVRSGRRRGAEARGEGLGDESVSGNFQKGLEVEGKAVPRQLWKTGERIVATRATYWEEPVTVAGIIKAVLEEGGQLYLRIQVEGSQAESLVKWAGLNPMKYLEVHVCHPDCPKMAREGLVHGNRFKLRTGDNKEAWMENLIEMRRPGAEEEDELQKVREKADERRGGRPEEGQRPPGAGEEEEISSESEAAGKRKKKKKKRRAERGRVKISGTKELGSVFGATALDPKPEVRKTIRKRARRAAKKRSKKQDSTSSGSPGSSSDSGSSLGEGAQLFGEEVRVKMVWKRFPGALTLNTLEFIQAAVVSQTGQPWQLDRSSLPPIFSQYWRQALSNKMGGAMSREAQTLCFAQDLLIQGRVAAACDVLTQRLKGLEQVTAGSHYLVSQRQELVPVDTAMMTSPTEALEAARLQREEQRSRTAAARPWERRAEWERRPEENKGKGKTKDTKGKGKTKGDHQGQREEKEKGKK